MTAPARDRASAAAWLLVGLAIVLASPRYGLGSLDAPGTGFMPFLAGLAMMACAGAGLLAPARRAAPPVPRAAPRPVPWGGLAVVTGALLGWALGVGRLGFVVATTLLLGVLFRVARPWPWPAALAGGLGAALASWLLFERWLHAGLPRGPWGF